MSQPKLIIQFERLSEPAFMVKSEHIVTSLTGNSNCPGPWPAGVPSLATITTDFNNYKAAAEAAKDGDKVKVAQRNEARAKLTKDLKAAAPYLEILGNGSVAVLQSFGYDLRHDRVKSVVAVVPAEPSGFKVKRGPTSGSLIGHAKADKTVDTYEVQFASADPSVDANWGPSALVKHCNRVELTGLTPGKTYYVRIRGNNKHGHGPWATSAGIMVV